MDFWQEVLQNLIGYGVALALAAIIAAALYGRFPSIRDNFWPLHRLRPGAWTGFEVFIAFVILTYAAELARSLLEFLGLFEMLYPARPPFMRQMLWAYPLYFFLALALILLMLYSRSGARPRHFGLSRARWPQCVAQGLIGFAVTTPLILGVFFVSAELFDQVPHDLDKLAKEGLRSDEWMLLFLQACVVAPVLEEICFRGLLQGWLRRASVVGHLMICAWTLAFASMPLLASAQGVEGAPDSDITWRPAAFGLLLVLLYAWRFFFVWGGVLREGPAYLLVGGPSLSLVQHDGDAAQTSAAPPALPPPLLDFHPERFARFQRGNGQLAILGSAMFFAVAHSGAWPSPIALFLLGLALGWLAHRTQSLIGCITWHAFFNIVAFLSLYQA